MSSGPNLKIEKIEGIVAWGLWLIALVSVSILIWRAPNNRNDCGVYFGSSQLWQRGENLYSHNYGVEGFLYLPQFAVMYTPFQWMGNPVGDVVWRAIGAGILATGLWRIARGFSRRRYWVLFALFTAATLPPTLASLRNGQANLFVAGMMLHAAQDLRSRQWWRASFWLVGGLIVKPIIVVMLLLAGVVYRPAAWRIAICLMVAFALPFAFQRPSYVWEQYRSFVGILNSSTDRQDLNCNIRGLFGTMGWIMPHAVFIAIAGSAAALTLGLCLFARRRWDEPMRAFFLLAFSACYLMLFNPRTESNSYVILAPVVAIPAGIVWAMFGRWRVAAVLYVFSFMLVCDGWAYHITEYWLKPVTCLVFWFLLIKAATKRKRQEVSIQAAETPATSPAVAM